MNQKTLEHRVKQVIAEQTGFDASKITGETLFIKDLACDSLDELELVIALEEEFEIELPDNYGMPESVQQAIDIVMRKVREKAQ